MELPVLGLLGIGGLVALRLISARRVAAGDGRFVWIFFALPLLIGVYALATALSGLRTAGPLAAIALAAAGGVILFGAGRLAYRTARGIKGARGEDEVLDAMVEPLVDFTLLNMGFVLLAGLIAVIGLIVWGLVGR